MRSYYGAHETRAYFSGCSNGGRQALMEAQRYPDDFDGIVAGAPAARLHRHRRAVHQGHAGAQFPDPKQPVTPLFPPETLKSVEAQILEKCDALDGVKDGVMEDPRQCKVDVVDADRTERRAGDGAEGDLRATTPEQGRRDLSGAAVRRRRRGGADGRRGSPASTPR